MKNTLMNGGHAAPGWIYSAAEHHLYGSSRLGVHQTNLVLASRNNQDPIVYIVEETEYTTLTRGKRNYELSNHLGNVQVVVTDKRVSVCDEYLGVERFEAEVLSAMDYYPFGMMMPDRQYYASNDSSNYRFGFNGMERENEISGQGNNLDFGARIYDSRLGRWLSLDPLMVKYPSYSPYTFCLNNPVFYYDKDGRDVGNGPKKVVNNSSVPITIAGDGNWVSNRTGNEIRRYKEQVTLNPGDVFEPDIREHSSGAFKVNGGKVTRADGTIEYVDLHDVDFIDVQEGQTLVVEEGIFWETTEEVKNDPKKEFNNGPKDYVPKKEIRKENAPNADGPGDYVKTPQKGEIKLWDGGKELKFTDHKDKKGKKSGKVQVDYDGIATTN